MSYIDGCILPLKDGQRETYREMAEMFARKATELGAIASIEALGDNLEHGHTTDFFRAVKAEESENVIFSVVVWPDKQTRDEAWEKIMADPEMQPSGEMPFDGKRMIWGGFNPIVNTLDTRG